MVALWLLGLVGAIHLSANPPVFPTCTKKCGKCEARVFRDRSRAWGRLDTIPPPSHLMEHWRGKGLIDLVVARLRFTHVAAYWMSLIWGKELFLRALYNHVTLQVPENAGIIVHFNWPLLFE